MAIEGNDYFLYNGVKVKLWKILPEGYLVEKYVTFFEDYTEYEDMSGVKEFVDKIFVKAPTEIIDKRISEAKNKLKTLQTQISEKSIELTKLDRDIYTTKESKDTLMSKLQKDNDKLLSLNSFLNGDIKYVVISSYYNGKVSIQELKYLIENKDYFESSKPLLYLEAGYNNKNEKEIRWATKDDAYSRSTIYPFANIEDAKTKAKEIVESKYNNGDSVTGYQELENNWGIEFSQEMKNGLSEIAELNIINNINNRLSSVLEDFNHMIKQLNEGYIGRDIINKSKCSEILNNTIKQIENTRKLFYIGI
jgi:hypothetical protein